MKQLNALLLLALCLCLSTACGDDTSSYSRASSKENKKKAGDADPASDDATEADDEEESEDGPSDPPPPAGDPNVVEFRIADGTGNSPWNTPATAVTVQIGKTLRLINDDTSGNAAAAKRLHTNGAPCGHMDKNIPPGGYADCLVKNAYNFEDDPPLYNHNVGESAQFYMKTIP